MIEDAMEQQALKNYKSRRNNVRLMQTDAGQFVAKTFSEEDAFQKELHVYKLLEGKNIPCANIIKAESKTLILSVLPGKTLVDCLEDQEQANLPNRAVWDKLALWLTAFWRQTGLIMTDVNLRNFLYDEKSNTLYGVDFEECHIGNMLIPAARVAAFIRTYTPENTPLKQEISNYVLEQFVRNCELEVEELLSETARQETKILARRKNKI